MARGRLADELLARSLKGSAEQILRGGAIIGERHHFDNRLAYAILRRLDRRAELGATFRNPPRSTVHRPPPAETGEWQPLLEALADERQDDAARLLALPVGGSDRAKGNEGNNPPFGDDEGDEFRHPRIWQEWGSDEWRTSYPPPDDFFGDERGEWGEPDYSRALSEEEMDALIAAGIAEAPYELEVTLEEDEAERDAFFARLAADYAASGVAPV